MAKNRKKFNKQKQQPQPQPQPQQPKQHEKTQQPKQIQKSIKKIIKTIRKTKKNYVRKDLKGNIKLLDKPCNIITYDDLLDKYEVLNEVKKTNLYNTFKVRSFDDNRIYEMRMFKVLEEDIIENYNYNSIWRLKYLLESMNNKYANRFFNIKEDMFIQFCKYIPNKFNLNSGKLYKKSKYCYVIIRDMVNDTLSNKLNLVNNKISLNTKQFLSIMIQVLDIYQMLKTNKFVVNNPLTFDKFLIKEESNNIKLSNNNQVRTFNGYQVYLKESLDIMNNLYGDNILSVTNSLDTKTNYKSLDNLLNEKYNYTYFRNDIIKLNDLIYFLMEGINKYTQKQLYNFVFDLYKKNNTGAIKYYLNSFMYSVDKKDYNQNKPLDNLEIFKNFIVIFLLSNNNFNILKEIKTSLVECFTDLKDKYQKNKEVYFNKMYKYTKNIINSEKAEKYKEKYDDIKIKISNLKKLLDNIKKNNFNIKNNINISNTLLCNLIYQQDCKKLQQLLETEIKK
jgi:hypothetical protein